MTEAPALQLAEIAARPGPLPERAEALLHELGRHVPFDAAWMALAAPMGTGYTSVASTADLSTVQYLGPRTAYDIEVAATGHACPPLGPSFLPHPAEELSAWAGCLVPTGFHEALVVALFAPESRHVGLLALLSARDQPPTPAMRRRLEKLSPILARGIDPMGPLVNAARLVPGAEAGVVVCRDGGTAPLPGLADDALLAGGSAVVAAAGAALRDGQVYRSFLWPRGGRHAPGGHVRVTVVTCTGDVPRELLGMVLLSPAGDLRGLTPRELEVLGLVIEGYTNQGIAREIVVAPRTVAAHLEHILGKLEAPSRTLAAVRAERTGLYVPPGAGAYGCR
jgi:DNA-binding CsgD family transcriptional regulator